MAAIQRNTETGVFIAVWRDANGQRVTASTGETLHERAWIKAAALEAEARFWEDHAVGVWQRLADAAFSPRYLHTVFVGRAHIVFPRFRGLLREAGVKLQPASRWRDRTQARGAKSDKRWSWRGGKRTLDDLLEHADATITRAALRFRLTSGWAVEDALSKPLMSRSESGSIGAAISNNPNRKAR
jgi:hypothetical protein